MSLYFTLYRHGVQSIGLPHLLLSPICNHQVSLRSGLKLHHVRAGLCDLYAEAAVLVCQFDPPLCEQCDAAAASSPGVTESGSRPAAVEPPRERTRASSEHCRRWQQQLPPAGSAAVSPKAADPVQRLVDEEQQRRRTRLAAAAERDPPFRLDAEHRDDRFDAGSPPLVEQVAATAAVIFIPRNSAALCRLAVRFRPARPISLPGQFARALYPGTLAGEGTRRAGVAASGRTSEEGENALPGWVPTAGCQER